MQTPSESPVFKSQVGGYRVMVYDERVVVTADETCRQSDLMLDDARDLATALADAIAQRDGFANESGE